MSVDEGSVVRYLLMSVDEGGIYYEVLTDVWSLMTMEFAVMYLLMPRGS